MPTWKDIETEVRLGDGESAMLLIDPRHEIGRENGTYGTVFLFPVTMEDGSMGVLRGGKRLRDAFVRAGVKTWTAPTRVKLTARGAPRTLARDYVAERIV